MSGPIVGKRRLRAELRRLRRERELTQDQVAADMEWSLSKLIRIENGTVAISVSDLRSLLAYYRVHDTKMVDDLLELARAAKRRMWWDEYRASVPSQMLTYVGFEAEAVAIGEWSPIMFPAMMQTRRYASATSVVDHNGDSPVAERRVEFRMRRQDELLSREQPPRVLTVLDESVLRRQPVHNDEALLVDQIEHAIEFAQRPYADVRIAPLNMGYHPGWEGEFTLLEFGADDGVLYRQGLLWEEPDAVVTYREVLRRLADRALAHDASIDFMRQVAGELKRG
ncbi:helix-turn-helix transcriptional regulator [Dactylosporangium fulvum]|uniref:Helix-turn-helix transcriptional regulator n=1 Tax=Dactylosporangium fulvum TaxID=53359 RepID=A0ABY5W1M1_9ACTN|nr:helix-turn-helix transcriptional regulator [Dactylosporangium fulvum]UWP83837.1 helix-turn-helix transcriptional regulator [Dactylosporangium fulvum]